MAKCPKCGAPVNLAPDGDPKYEPPRAYREATPAAPAQVGEWQREAAIEICEQMQLSQFGGPVSTPGVREQMLVVADQFALIIAKHAPSAPAPSDKLVAALEPFAGVPRHTSAERKLIVIDAKDGPWHILQSDLDRARDLYTALSAHRSGGKTGGENE